MDVRWFSSLIFCTWLANLREFILSCVVAGLRGSGLFIILFIFWKRITFFLSISVLLSSISCSFFEFVLAMLEGEASVLHRLACCINQTLRGCWRGFDSAFACSFVGFFGRRCGWRWECRDPCLINNLITVFIWDRMIHQIIGLTLVFGYSQGAICESML